MTLDDDNLTIEVSAGGCKVVHEATGRFVVTLRRMGESTADLVARVLRMLEEALWRDSPPTV